MTNPAQEIRHVSIDRAGGFRLRVSGQFECVNISLRVSGRTNSNHPGVLAGSSILM